MNLTRKDWSVFITVLIIICLVLIWDAFRSSFISFTIDFPFIAGFLKFAILATSGECLAMRILHGKYVPAGFGLAAKALVWGFLGLFTTSAFAIYYNGVPVMLANSGATWAPLAMAGGLSVQKIMVAFSISFCMNIMFAPVLMVAHKVADMRIKANNGSLSGNKLGVVASLKTLDWDAMWNFVLCRTVLFFWIPAHTCVFLLPGPYRVLTAAVLGAVLGLILALAGQKKHQEPPEVLL